jgi:hypothetical protein
MIAPMQVGLRLARLKHENQKVVELTYKDRYVGEGHPDLIVRLGRDKDRRGQRAIGRS